MMMIRRVVVALLLAGAAPVAAQVRPTDLSKLSPSDFRDDELDLPYYLVNFHRVANSVALSGPRRGFIDIPVWRNLVDNKPHNARIMESILSLAYFYTLNRPWNPYRGDPALRARLEAALEFWANSQNSQGAFSEYAPDRFGLAPTAFATKFMGETLRLLKSGPPIDAVIHKRAIEADRKAIMASFTLPDLQEHGRMYTNQISNAYAGAFAYLALYPDAKMKSALEQQLKMARRDHQSPVGYFYEAGGPDWGYNLNTHHSNFHMAWHYARGTPLARELTEPMRLWYEWLSYNAVPEPNTIALTLNRAIESRQRHAVVEEAGPGESDTGTPIAEVVPGARVLGPTREQLLQRYAQRRAELTQRWPNVDTLTLGTFRTFSPYVFLHRSQVRWYPSDAQWKAARSTMRPVRESRFTHQRVDSRKPTVFTFVRRPSYYAAVSTGDTYTAMQRFGLGLLWNPTTGTLLQSQSAGTNASWGTRAADTSIVYEARTIPATFTANGKPVLLRAGTRDLPNGLVRIRYPLGSAGMKTIELGEEGIHVQVTHRAAFVEQLPLLLLATDSIEATAGRLVLRRGTSRMTVDWKPASDATIARTSERIGDRQVAAVSVRGVGQLSYDIHVESGGRN